MSFTRIWMVSKVWRVQLYYRIVFRAHRSVESSIIITLNWIRFRNRHSACISSYLLINRASELNLLLSSENTTGTSHRRWLLNRESFSSRHFHSCPAHVETHSHSLSPNRIITHPTQWMTNLAYISTFECAGLFPHRYTSVVLTFSSILTGLSENVSPLQKLSRRLATVLSLCNDMFSPCVVWNRSGCTLFAPQIAECDPEPRTQKSSVSFKFGHTQKTTTKNIQMAEWNS